MRKFTPGEWIVVLFNLAYIIGFAIYYISIKNLEFLWYIGVLGFFFFAILITLDKSKFSLWILWGLSLWGLLHMMGGGVRIEEGVLYNLQIMHLFDVGDTYVLKFDQLVHAYGYFVTTFVVAHIWIPRLRKNPNRTLFYLGLIFISMGLGALNEIVEFIATVSFENVNVGGYYNTGIDIISNTIGAIIAVIIIHFKSKRIFL